MLLVSPGRRGALVLVELANGRREQSQTHFLLPVAASRKKCLRVPGKEPMVRVGGKARGPITLIRWTNCMLASLHFHSCEIHPQAIPALELAPPRCLQRSSGMLQVACERNESVRFSAWDLTGPLSQLEGLRRRQNEESEH